jgi:hypothetical protein
MIPQCFDEIKELVEFYKDVKYSPEELNAKLASVAALIESDQDDVKELLAVLYLD